MSEIKTIFFNKYTDGSKDLTYKESDRKDLSYYTLRDYTPEEYNRVVQLEVDQVKKLIESII